MTKSAKTIVEEIDFVTEGMKRLEVVDLPPKVQWGEKFQVWPDDRKLEYLTKFAEAMNHAASTLQDERDELNTLLKKKEQRIEQLETMLEANNNMLQIEFTKMNQYKQECNKHAAELNARIRELESGNLD